MANNQTYAKVLDLVETVGEIVKVAEQINNKQQEKAASAVQISSVIEELKQTGLLPANQTKLAEEQLGSHAATMNILLNVVQSYKEAKAKQASTRVSEDFGRPEKSASAAPKQSARDEKLLALINR